MNGRKRARVAMLALTAVALGPAAFGQSVPVSTTVVGGTRTLNLLSASGGSLNSISLGTNGAAPFIGNVTDVRYSRAGYQVSASLSDLYSYDGSSYDCGTKIASSSFGLEFVLNPISLADVAALAEPVWDVAGTVDATLAALLGIPAGTALTAADVAGEKLDRDLSGVFTGVQSSLPIQVAAGAGGLFSAPAPHPSCDSTPGGATTSRTIMAGTVNSAADVGAWVASAVQAAADSNTDGAVTGTELVGSGEVTDETLVAAARQALIDAGASPALIDTLVASGTLNMSSVYALLTASLDPVLNLVGQTGSYVSLPKLVSNVPAGTAPGTYRGQLVVTMVDV